MSKIKCERIASDMIRIISNILANGSRDELLKTVTITGCTVSNDLSYAKVYFTSTSNLTPKEMEKEMKEASGFIRHELAEKIDIRHTPELNFVYDESIEYGNRIESIIKEINSIQREKDQAKEVKKGFECGITLDKYSDIKEKDIIEAYEEVEIKR